VRLVPQTAREGWQEVTEICRCLSNLTPGTQTLHKKPCDSKINKSDAQNKKHAKKEEYNIWIRKKLGAISSFGHE
jgi:hypothetical protein